MSTFATPNLPVVTLSRRKLGMLIGGVAAGLTFGPVHAATPLAKGTVDFDALLEEAIEAGIPGVAMAVSRQGAILYSGAKGVSNLHTQSAVEPDDRFRIYSITKAYTAIVVLQLVDEGLLSLEDNVSRWVDSDAALAIPNVDHITIRQLLTHTGGVYDFADDSDSPFWEDAFLGPDADWTRVWSIDELLAYAAANRHDPYFAPGDGHHYSNTDYLLLGLIVEQATGNQFGDELQRRVLDPLGADNTFLAEGGSMPDGTIPGYQFLEEGPVDVGSTNLSWIWTAGGMTSNTQDLQIFAEALFSGAFLSQASFREMFEFVATAGPKSWGMGVYRVTTDAGTLTGMDGEGPGFNSSMMRHDDSGITVAILANAAPDRGVDALRDKVFAQMLASS